MQFVIQIVEEIPLDAQAGYTLLLCRTLGVGGLHWMYAIRLDDRAVSNSNLYPLAERAAAEADGRAALREMVERLRRALAESRPAPVPVPVPATPDPATRQWLCHFCLEPTAGASVPAACGGCRVVYCRACGSALKRDETKSSVRYCYGCGLIDPPAEARFTAETSTASVYLFDAWLRRNVGATSTGFYHILVGNREPAGAPPYWSAWLEREASRGEHETTCETETVRELTPREKEHLDIREAKTT